MVHHEAPSRTLRQFRISRNTRLCDAAISSHSVLVGTESRGDLQLYTPYKRKPRVTAILIVILGIGNGSLKAATTLAEYGASLGVYFYIFTLLYPSLNVAEIRCVRPATHAAILRVLAVYRARRIHPTLRMTCQRLDRVETG